MTIKHLLNAIHMNCKVGIYVATGFSIAGCTCSPYTPLCTLHFILIEMP